MNRRILRLSFAALCSLGVGTSLWTGQTAPAWADRYICQDHLRDRVFSSNRDLSVPGISSITCTRERLDSDRNQDGDRRDPWRRTTTDWGETHDRDQRGRWDRYERVWRDRDDRRGRDRDDENLWDRYERVWRDRDDRQGRDRDELERERRAWRVWRERQEDSDRYSQRERNDYRQGYRDACRRRDEIDRRDTEAYEEGYRDGLADCQRRGRTVSPSIRLQF